MDTGLQDLLSLRTFLMSSRTIHWITIILKNYGIPKYIIDLLKTAENNLIITASKNILHESIGAITDAEVDKMYQMDQELKIHLTLKLIRTSLWITAKNRNL
jgi:hypothetical protein